MKIYCRGCGNELWYDEDEQDGKKLYYTHLCNECDSAHLALRDVLHEHFKSIEAGIVALSINVVSGAIGEQERKIALRSLRAIIAISDVLQRIGG